MSVAGTLRSLLRERLTTALDQVLTEALTRVLLELDRALEDFEAGSGKAEEPLNRDADVQFPELQVKYEPQKSSSSISELLLPAPPRVKQEHTDTGRSPSDVWMSQFSHVKLESTDRGRSLSDEAEVEEFNLQISCATSLNTVLSPNAEPETESRGRQILSEEQEQSVPNRGFALKVPVIKLHPLFPKPDSKKQKMDSEDKKMTTTCKRRDRRRRSSGDKYMCLCGKLFSKEALGRHQEPLEGDDLCPALATPFPTLSRCHKRQSVEGFTATASGPEPDKVLEHEGREDTTGPRVQAQHREGEEKHFIQTYFTDTSLSKSKTSPNEKRKVSSGDTSAACEPGALFFCDLCGCGFSWLPRLYEHRKSHFGTSPFWCSDCGRTFRRCTELRTHLCIQTGEKPHSCSVCGDSFFLSLQLHKHMRQHRAAARRARKQTKTGPEPD